MYPNSLYRQMMATALQISGALAITAGAALIFIPAGFLVGGIFLLLFGLAAERN